MSQTNVFNFQTNKTPKKEIPPFCCQSPGKRRGQRSYIYFRIASNPGIKKAEPISA